MATTSSSSNRRAALALAGLICALPACAVAADLSCPPSSHGSPLKTVTVFDGPPEELADLVPDTYRKTADGGTSMWNVAYIFAQGRQLNIRCDYGSQTAPVVIQPPASVVTCSFTTHRAAPASLTCAPP